ncbi:MAG: hypothetical protein ABI759_01950 [Candidatus Solibacter sp.]
MVDSVSALRHAGFRHLASASAMRAASNATWQSIYTSHQFGHKSAHVVTPSVKAALQESCPGDLIPMLPTLLFLAILEGGPPPTLTAPEILERMVQADNDRLAALDGYSGLRNYRFENKKTGKTAGMTVRMTCGSDGVKMFEVVSETGSGFVRSHILRKMIEAETESSQKGERKESRIIPGNYDFRLVGTEISDGRNSYVLEINPKKPTKFAIRGRIWVDAEDFAIARVEGQPAKNPSFWIRSVNVEQRYGRSGQFWLPTLNHSVAQARVFGATEVVIEYSDYKTNARESRMRAHASEE